MTDKKPSFSEKAVAGQMKTDSECKKSSKKPDGPSSRRSSSHAGHKSAEHPPASAAPAASSRRGKKAPDYCFPSRTVKHLKCNLDLDWQRNKYVRDECGSGIVTSWTCPEKRRIWCNTPLSMYQATIGEMGRKILCGEVKLHKELFPPPPCNVCEDILRPCRGYYRKYDCIRACEEDLAIKKEGKTVYRSATDRYWNPCEMFKDTSEDIRNNAAHNSYLSRLMRRRDMDCNQQPCW